MSNLLFNLGMQKATLFSFEDTIILSGYREEHFVDINSTEIQINLTVNDCSKKQYMEVIIFNEMERKNIFSQTNNFQPICCIEKHSDHCQHGLISINSYTTHFTQYLIKPTCTHTNYTIPKYLKNRPDFHFQNTSTFPIYDINHKFYIHNSSVYSVLIANCSPDNISISGNIILKPINENNHLLDKVLKKYEIQLFELLFLSCSFIVLFGISFKKKSPSCTKQHTTWILSMVFGIINYILKIIYLLIWDQSNNKFGLLLLFSAIFYGFSFCSLIYLISNALEIEFLKSSFYILLSLLFILGNIYDTNEFIHHISNENLFWFLSYGKFPIIFFVVFSYFFLTFIYYYKHNASNNYHMKNYNKIHLFVIFIFSSFIFYFISSIVFSIYLLDLSFFELRIIYNIGSSFDQILLLILSIVNGWFWINYNNDGWTQLDQEFSDDQKVSLVGNGVKRSKRSNIIFTNSDHEYEENTLSELHPIETS